MKHAYPLFVLLSLSLAGCAPASFDPAAEGTALLRRDAEWANAASAGKDVEKIVSYWSEDAVVLPPGQPELRGKAAIRAYVSGSLKIPGFRIHWKSSNVRFSPDGNLAYMDGANEVTVPGANGKPVTQHGRGITVWRRDPDGQWRCVVDIWNDPPGKQINAGRGNDA
jgi:uncharacterized protein (TIGR02246 family)